MSCAVVDVAVVGAGLSGLVAAASVYAAAHSVAVLDARPRLGGRLLGVRGVDLGGSWSWASDSRVAKLARTLGVEPVAQHLDGEAFHRGRAIGNQGESMAPCGPGALRHRGGYPALVDGLAAKLPAESLLLSSKVTAIEVAEEGVRLTYIDARAASDALPKQLLARRVIVAAPPGVVAAGVTFSPPLPSEQARKQAGTATWCGDWAKVAATFKTAFWREKGASGCVATDGDGGPLSIWWEGGGGAPAGEETFALVGLGVGPQTAALASLESAEGAEGRAAADGGAAARSLVVSQLGAAFGRATVEEQLESVAVKAWINDELTYAAAGSHRDYGHPLLRAPAPWGVHWAGTETERENGHVEGAIQAGHRAASEVVTALRAK